MFSESPVFETTVLREIGSGGGGHGGGWIHSFARKRMEWSTGLGGWE